MRRRAFLGGLSLTGLAGCLGLAPRWAAADTLRFYALRLREAVIKTTPEKIIAQGSDWRFLTALKRELKG